MPPYSRVNIWSAVDNLIVPGQAEVLGALAQLLVVEPSQLGLAPWQTGLDILAFYSQGNNADSDLRRETSVVRFLPQIDERQVPVNDQIKRWMLKTVWAISMLLDQWQNGSTNQEDRLRTQLNGKLYNAFSNPSAVISDSVYKELLHNRLAWFMTASSEVLVEHIRRAVNEVSSGSNDSSSNGLESLGLHPALRFDLPQWAQLSDFRKVVLCGFALGLEKPSLFNGIVAGHPNPMTAYKTFSRLPQSLPLRSIDAALRHVRFQDFLPVPLHHILSSQSDLSSLSWLLSTLSSFAQIVEQDFSASQLAHRGRSILHELSAETAQSGNATSLQNLLDPGSSRASHWHEWLAKVLSVLPAKAERVTENRHEALYRKIHSAQMAQRVAWQTNARGITFAADIELAPALWQTAVAHDSHYALLRMYSVVRAHEYLVKHRASSRALLPAHDGDGDAALALLQLRGPSALHSGSHASSHYVQQMNSLAGSSNVDKHLILTENGVALTPRQYRRAFRGSMIHGRF
ncbi:hypothetical protein OIV83_005299 [Microbotryomycetes sp. JL201]|nr:hypothetical protein OIV83_005299 [Microbotryomycetes sp. JL201]